MLQTALLAVIIIALNYLSFHHYTRADLSRSADYTLSSATRRYLASDALAQPPATGQVDHGIPPHVALL